MHYRVYVKFKGKIHTVDCDSDGWFVIEGREDVNPMTMTDVRYTLETIDQGLISMDKNSKITIEPVL